MRINLVVEVNGKKAKIDGEFEFTKAELIAFGMNPVSTVKALILGEQNGLLQTEDEFDNGEFEKAHQQMRDEYEAMSKRVAELFKK